MKSKNRPVVVDLFAGAGGLSLGFEQAGFDILCAVEIDPIHALVHEFNFPNTKVIAKSVTDIDGDYIRKVAGLDKTDTIDVLVGGAPCQGFSLIGQRAIDDPRNSLVKDYIRLVKELKPTHFVFENVKGLTVGKHKKFLQEIINELIGSGYNVRLPWRVLNAKDFSVPQSRERLFLIGSLEGADLPEYPAPTNSPVTCKDALEDLPDAEEFTALSSTDSTEFSYTKKAIDYSSEMRCSTSDSWKFGYIRYWNSKMLTCSRRTEHSEISRRRFNQTIPGNVEPISRFFRLPMDGVSNTLRAGTDAARGAFTSPRPIHYKYDRCITVREMARLHGFPDWFRFHGTKWHGARQIGNAVPPPLAFSLAKEIMKVLPYTPEQPKIKLKLGDPNLLYSDLSAASRYWGIKNPIGKRDKKSGVKKRSQSEIEQLNLISA